MEAMNFYQNLFTAQEDLDPDLVCRHVPKKVTDEMAEGLLRVITGEEVERALFQMGPSKAPGTDGSTAGFFQKHWQLVGETVTKAVLGFLNGGEMPGSIYKTILVLIPKVANPQEMTQFRSISLCNVSYKLCSKVLANRLRGVLDEIISEEQSAFVPGRLITDNVLIAYEVIHYLRNKKVKVGARAIKLDMAKAYDRVEWSYLQSVMLALGFPAAWCDLVMKCVTSVSFSVRVNGVLSSTFKPTRGIRQGDPISPYLFLLCSEGLTSMLKSRGPQYISKGIRVSCRAPWISHLLFTDDCCIFTQASERGAHRISGILDLHNRGWSAGKQREVSRIFSGNCDDVVKQVVKTKLEIPTEALGEKYLGLPMAVGKAGDGTFDYVNDRIRGLAQGWSEQLLSCAGREVLIKANAQAVPTYPMSCFKLPAQVLKKIKSYISNFWWGSSVDSHKIHWQRWTRLTRAKGEGGMSFREMPLFNQAMLGKQGWRLLVRPESLCAKVLKGSISPIVIYWRRPGKRRAWRLSERFCMGGRHW